MAWRTIGKLHERKVAFAVDLNQREIGLLVGADDLGCIACTIVRLRSQLQARSEPKANNRADRRTARPRQGGDGRQKRNPSGREDLVFG
jgi:hypothetical protein